MLFEGWEGLERTFIVGVLAYLAIVILLRVTGKRTLSKWNAFDFIVTIALGSTLATAILSKDVPLAQGVVGFGVLILLQYVVTWLTTRSHLVHRLVKSEPTLLLYQGRYQYEAMQRERVTASEIRGALREHGIGSVDAATAVVLETSGEFSVVQKPGSGDSSTLAGVKGFENPGNAEPADR